MPALAVILRTVIMALASAAPLTVAQEFVDGTVKKLVNYIKDEDGLTLDEAKGIVGNILADLALNATIIGGILKTKMAIKTAEFLGFPAKNVAKRALSTKAAKAAAKYAGPLEKFKSMSLVNKIITAGGLFGGLTWIGVGIANVIEPGIYKPREANDVWQRFTGVRPFPEKAVALSPGNLDAARFNDLARSLEAAGLRGFNDPVKLQSRLYSREDLADIIDYAYGKALLAGKTIKDYRDILPLIQPYFIGGATIPSTSSDTAITSPAPASTSQVKVFTGVVSQGIVGAGLTFTPRPDDLIESLAELQDAINNNVSTYLAALPSKVVYEIKVVSSIIVGGIRKSGTSQRIISGYYKNGTPKYRNITNKFAVADLYILTDRGTRSKLTSIVLGPTDALQFQPDGSDLVSVAAQIASNVITVNTDDIKAVMSNTPTAALTPTILPEIPQLQPQNIPAGEPTIFAPAQDPSYDFGNTRFVTRWEPLPTGWVWIYDAAGRAAMHKQSSSVQPGWSWEVPAYVRDIVISKGTATISPPIITSTTTSAGVSPPASAPTQGIQPPVTQAPASALPSGALTAQTLYEFYTALGRSLPSISERAAKYQALGLGQAAFYAGTAEQNTRLLQTLKSVGV